MARKQITLPDKLSVDAEKYADSRSYDFSGLVAEALRQLIYRDEINSAIIEWAKGRIGNRSIVEIPMQGTQEEIEQAGFKKDKLEYVNHPQNNAETDLTGKIPSKDALNSAFAMSDGESIGVGNTEFAKCDHCFQKNLLKEVEVIENLERETVHLCPNCIRRAKKDGKLVM